MNPSPPAGRFGSLAVEFINPWMKFRGALIPNWLLMRREVSHGAKLCYARLMQFAGKDGRCNPRQETLANALGCSVRRVRAYLRELKANSLISTNRPGLKRANFYRFQRHPWMDDSPNETVAQTVPDRKDFTVFDRQDSTAPDRQDSTAPLYEKRFSGRDSVEEYTHTSALPPPPSLEDVQTFASMQCIPPEAAVKFYHEREASGWMQRPGLPILNWRASMIAYASSWRAVSAQQRVVARRGRSAGTAFAISPPRGAFASSEI